MSNKNLATEILVHIGGKENVSMVTHCATRLRFNLKDNKKADKKAMEKLEGVLGVVEKGGQFQVVIGNEVANVFQEVTTLGDFNTDRTAEEDVKQGVLNTVFDTIAGIFTPFLPALIGAGMIKAVMSFLVVLKLVDSGTQIYAILNIIADSAFYFMPMMLAYSAAQKFKTNPYLAMTLGGILLHPNFVSMVDIAKAGGDPLSLLGIPIPLVSYSSSVIPIILSVWFMSFVYKTADRISPKIIKFLFVPLVTTLVTAPIMLVAIGPLGNYIGNVVAAGISFLDTRAGWLTPMLIGAFNPLLVMAGMHYAIVPFGLNSLATVGYDTLVGPGMLPSNIAQGGAALAVALRTKDSKLKQLASSAGVTALCGITEPAIYGVNLKLKRPFYAVLIAGGLGGLFAGIFSVRRYSSGPIGLLTLPVYLGDPVSNFVFAILACVVAFVAAFILTLVFGFEDPAEAEDVIAVKAEEKMIINNAAMSIVSPMSGETVPLSTIDDEMFSTEILGKGIAIKPDIGRVIAPFDGIVNVFVTKHAIGLVGDNGIELLIHVGLDTVKLDGKYFTAKVKNDTHIKKGEVILEFDMEAIESEGYQVVTPVIISNSNNFDSIWPTKEKQVQFGDDLVNINIMEGDINYEM